MARGLFTLAAILVLARICSADSFDDYQTQHPGTEPVELLDVSVGDSLDRVLAVIHHPDLGAMPRRVQVLQVGPEGANRLPAGAAQGKGVPGEGSLIVSVTSRCPGISGPVGESAVDSWFFLEDRALLAWSFQPYTRDCRPEAPLVRASNHAALRLVGEHLFRPARRGHFRYGPLEYERWEGAFSAPTRAATLSQLHSRLRPESAATHNRLAVGLYADGDRGGALAQLREAIRLAPHWSLPHRNLAVLYLQRGEIEQAEAETARAQALTRRSVTSPLPN